MLPDAADVTEAAIGSIVATLMLAVVFGLLGYTSSSEISAEVRDALSGSSNNSNTV